MKHVLITGCAGMIGSNLARHLLDNTDWYIVGVDDLSGGFKENLPLEYDNFQFHVSQAGEDIVHRLFNIFDFEVVYHCAAYAAEGLSPFIRKFNYTNNVVETAAIVNHCIENNSKLIFFSSIAVYGHGNPPFRETHVPKPIDPYGIAKYACEMDIRAAWKQHKLNHIIVRPFNVYGERQNIWDKYRNVFGIWMYNKLHDLPITIYGDGSQRRNFTYVGDILPVLGQFGDNSYGEGIYNLGTAVGECSIAEAAQIFSEVVGACAIEFLPERHEVHTAWPDVTKCQHLIKDHTSLREGLSCMWAWAQQQPKRERKSFGEYEITKGMYNVWKD